MAGTITFDHDKLGVIRRVIATCTADAADGSFPDTDIPRIDGHLLAIQTNPGATAPTDNYDITLVDGDGLDRLAGAGANRDTTTSERTAVPGAPACSPGEDLSLRLANNSVNSAVVVVTFIYAATGGSEAALTIASDQTPVPVASESVVVSATPTLDTGAYASGDSLHTAVIEFANAAREAGGTGFIEKLLIVDAALQSQPCELWLFSETVTPAAANAAHSISDADAAKCLGVIYSGPYYPSALNSVSVAKGIGLAFKVAATSLFGILVTRGTPTYAADSLTVSLQISQD